MHVQYDLIQASGTGWGVRGVGVLRTNEKVSFTLTEQFDEFSVFLKTKPENGVKHSSSGCSFESGNYVYSY